MSARNKYIEIKNAHEHNLKNIDVQIPHNALTVITGLSGSGKSSLAYQVLFKESQRRFLESFSSYSKQFLGKLEQPKVDEINMLPAALAIHQKTGVHNARSTLGTLSGIYDYLRLLFARLGERKCPNCTNIVSAIATTCPTCQSELPQILAKTFSFNSPAGACKTCNGLGITEQIDPLKLIADENKSIAEGALVPTTPNGYIVYSQVRVDELNKVCKAHNFSVEIPWNQLSKEQQDVIWYGSNRVKILFGKHSLESRLKWKGITAKPREEAFYKGMLPIMIDILKRDRNENILRFASAFTCSDCEGSRLNKEALSIQIYGRNIHQLAQLSLSDLATFLKSIKIEDHEEVLEDILEPIFKRLQQLELLSLKHLNLARPSDSLSGGEAQRVRLASQIGTGLQGILYILDEPSIGMHPSDHNKLIKVLHHLRDQGNTVVVVEHEEATIKAADYIIDMGPKAGIHGGQILFQGTTADFFKNAKNSPTAQTILEQSAIETSFHRNPKGYIQLKNIRKHNLKNIDVRFHLGSLNLVSGVSGAGKSTLIHHVLVPMLRNEKKNNDFASLSSTKKISRIIEIDQSSIGRTPRSNPATYTDLFDHIRSLLEKQDLAQKRGYKKGRFSFNNKGGRCEKCEGAGSIQLGMHFLGNVEITCDNCDGKRFNRRTLEVQYKGKNVSEILNLSISEAVDFFKEQPKIMKILEVLIQLDVGYLKLGQPSTSLSGGEAQRIKLASELYKTSKNHALYILDEPSTGLHKADMKHLIQALQKIVHQGHTVIVIEHDLDMIAQADHIIDLGPLGGDAGGQLVFQGSLKDLTYCPHSLTGQELKKKYEWNQLLTGATKKSKQTENIQFKGLSTHNLQHIDVEFPLNKTTVITGISGSGKTSLAFDSLYAESRNRFTENLSSYARRMMSKIKKAELENCSGLTPAIAIRQQRFQKNPRATVGTYSGIYDLYRLLYSRFGKDQKGRTSKLSMTYFSFNRPKSACTTCNGTGILPFADPQQFISNPEKSLLDGAMNGSLPGKFFGDSNGQFVHTLIQVGKELNVDFSIAYEKLSEEEKNIALYGCGDSKFDVEWQFKIRNRSGSHQLKTKWKGFANEILEDFLIKKDGKRGENFIGLIGEKECPNCHGERLTAAALGILINSKNISQLAKLPVSEAQIFLNDTNSTHLASSQIISHLNTKFSELMHLGLAYLEIDRPIDTLSAGEAQRLRIAGQLQSSLCGLTYIFDEPTAALHQKDINKLLESIEKLKNNGNTIVMVEHNKQAIKTADHIIDMGPGAGSFGGNIIAQGSLQEIMDSDQSITGKHLRKQAPLTSDKIQFETGISIKKAAIHNLKNIDLEIPKQSLVCISGVSGSGKSSLLFDCIAPSIKSKNPVGCEYISFSGFDSVSVMDQSPIGTSPFSNAATYTGFFDHIRELFSKLDQSRKLGLKKSHFSFNSKDGSCPHCKGSGKTKVALDFLADVWQTCDVCNGKRYVDHVLEVKYKGYSIFEILELSISKSAEVFEEHSKIRSALDLLIKTGLGYLKLGQPTSTLSGGERQRLKLAKELIESKKESSLFLFDEPSTGLHAQDVEQLIGVFQELVRQGHSVIVIEHNLQIIKASDWLIDLGPDGGPNGGQVLFSGPTKKIMDATASHTATSIMDSLKN